MQAYQFRNVETGLELKQLPIPTPENDQVLVEVRAAGLCHTDCNIISGKDETLFWKRPIVLGHEIAGVVVGLGSEVTKFQKGDRVVSIIGTTHPITFGDVTTSAGIGYDGGFAQYAVFYESKTLPIPEGVTFAQAAIATDAVATAYHAVVTEGRVSASSKVAIIGLGGLGLSAVQIASRSGARVYGIERETRKYAPAIQLGAFSCAKTLGGFPGVQFDVVLDFAGAGTTTSSAAKAVKPGGKVVLVGLASKETRLDTYEFIALGVTLVGSAGSSKEEVEKCLQMIAGKEFVPLIEEIPFSDVKVGLERLSKGDVVGRLYADPTKDVSSSVTAY